MARVLGSVRGVIEPWQRARSVEGQVEELSRQIDRWASPPVVLIGHSWGAWLSLLVSARHPAQVERLILVGSGPLRLRDARTISRRRRSRLSDAEWAEFVALSRRLAQRGGVGRSIAMRRLGELSERADAYDRIVHPSIRMRMDSVALREVGAEADRRRESGALLRAVRRVRAPVLVVHGRNDPHPIEGVVDPLRRAGLNVRVVPLSRCGHEPWWERHARSRFFAVLTRELRAKPRRTSPRRPARERRALGNAPSRVRSRVR